MNLISINDSNEEEWKTQEKALPVEINLAFPAIWYPQEKQKIIKIRSFNREWKDTDGNILSAEVKIKADMELGTLTTLDYRVLLCVIELWEEQGRPKRILFSITQIIKMLGSRVGGDTYKKVKNSLLRLASVNFYWNGAFYNFTKKEHTHIEEAFSVLSSLGIASKKQKNVTSQQCYTVLNEHVIINIVGNGSLPVKRSVIQSFHSPIAQLLYTHLDRQLYGTTEYSRTTKGLIEDLGLMAKRYQYLSRRKEILLECREEIIDKETGYGEKISYFELYEGRGNDWVVAVRRTGAPQNRNSRGSFGNPSPKVIALDNSSQGVTHKRPQAQDRLQQERLVEQQTTNTFLETFAHLFPKAKLNVLYHSKSVKEKTADFINTHGIDRAIDFLYYAHQLSKQQQYSQLTFAETPVYLFQFQIGKDSLTKLWRNERKRAVDVMNQEKALVEQLKKESLRRQKYPEYERYIRNLLDKLTITEKQKFDHFFKQKEKAYLEQQDSFFVNNYRKSPHGILRKQFTIEVLIEFSKQFLAVQVCAFDEWLSEQYPM